MDKINKIRGCLIGGAIGDALGYPVEFKDIQEIRNKYGEDGITDFEIYGGRAIVSDDTQMSLFTTEGLIECKDREYLSRIRKAYLDWYITQTRAYSDIDSNNLLEDSKLLKIKDLYRKRAPGNTCLDSIYKGCGGTIYNPINNSKGCGGVMRVAPIGLAFNSYKVGKGFINKLGAEAAALTHGHPLGYMSAFALVSIINDLVYSDTNIIYAVLNAINSLEYDFGETKEVKELSDILRKAIKLAKDSSFSDSVQYIEDLGQGWTGEEALAIAVYCSIKYENDFEKAIITSVNHSGDSDSTGSITGNIMGAYLGIDSIPKKWTSRVEFAGDILHLSDELYKKSQEL